MKKADRVIIELELVEGSESTLRLLYAGTEKNKARCDANRLAQQKSKLIENERQLKQDENLLFKNADTKKKEQIEEANTVASLPDDVNAYLQPLYVPSSTLDAWFDPDNYEGTVTNYEQEALPEFFCGKYPSKTPSVYIEYRNFIIELYRANPTNYLSATTCRRHL
jgi:hypothetical protein